MGCDDSLLCHLIYDNVSIHAPAWGATHIHGFCNETEEFQSTHPHGVRPVRIDFPHAVGSFNPRTRMGCDFCSCIMSLMMFLFQSTHPHGVRPPNFEYVGGTLLFQSTHPHGVRLSIAFCMRLSLLFQSTHPHGVRLSVSLLLLS